MDCPKCKTANADTERFCRRCHATLLYKCPACGTTQRHGGACDNCGVNFAKYAGMLVAQEQIRADRKHEKVRESVSVWKQIILLPITGGYSLIRHLFKRSRL